MRFHKSEIFVLIVMLLMLAAAAVLYFTLQSLPQFGNSAETDAYALLNMMLTGALGALGLAMILMLTLVMPAVRSHVKNETSLQSMTESLSARSETLEHEALTDGLTGMHNRRYFDDAVSEYLEQFQRIDKPIGMMVLDLDHFKSVNDTHGHDVGDEVLRQVARCLQEFTRYHDVVARLGGEEFAVVAPNMSREALIKLADRIRRAIASLTIQAGNVHLKVTISVGLAVWDRKETADDLYRRADMQLYQAKRAGRNRVAAAA